MWRCFFCSLLISSFYWFFRVWAKDLITGGQFVPLAKILGDIFIFRGTDICTPFLLSRAPDRSQTKKSNNNLGTNSQKYWPISQEFRGKLHRKAIGKKWPILWLFSRQISLEIDQFWADQTSLFNVFLTGHHLLFQQQYAPEMNQWQSL